MSYLGPEKIGPTGQPASEQSVTLTSEEAAAARWLLTKLVNDAGEQALVRQEQLPTSDADILTVARKIYHSRKRRAEHFGASLFSEPAWDMLLVLFLYGDREGPITVTRLAAFTDSPLTTAIRWLDYLESQRMIVRKQCPEDRRKFFVGLSEKGRSLLTGYFEDLIRSGEANPRLS